MAEEVTPQAATAAGPPLANFRYGVYANPGPFVGRNIAEVRTHLGGLWSVPPDATAFKGFQKLNDNYIVQKGDQIEFHRRMR